MMQLKALSGEDYRELSSWAWCNHVGPGGSEKRRLEGATLPAVKRAEGAMSQETQAASRERDGALESPERTQPY